ncbi:hypothetical protein V500_10616 [Pseudogymnoascus sp. VKM F-4518 (FW-2643)]|nr:hypothetical protein V500_10616 [Pseudogymnoascus sp. VKM F-4518 (FW-2643)]
MSGIDGLVSQSQYLSLGITSLVYQAANEQRSAPEAATAQLEKLGGEGGKERKLAKHIVGEQVDADTAEIDKLRGNQVVLLLSKKLVDS